MKRSILFIFCFFVFSPRMVVAFPDQALQDVYWKRADLRASFDPAHYRAVPNSHAGFLIDLEDWATQYGWSEYPKELTAYAPQTVAPIKKGDPRMPTVTAQKYIILDRASGKILAAKNAGDVWPIASLTKLTTAKIVSDRGGDLEKLHDVQVLDDVGGAKLSVRAGEQFSVRDLFYATLMASANNAANALARSTALPRETFIQLMNTRAAELNLTYTRFTDPSGFDLGNVSTAREMARIAEHAFADDLIRSCAATSVRSITLTSTGAQKKLTSTNWMLYKPEFDDLFVTGGKTGYLDESGWNLALTLRPSANDKKRELLLVLFGSASRIDSFRDAKALARWTWKAHNWK